MNSPDSFPSTTRFRLGQVRIRMRMSLASLFLVSSLAAPPSSLPAVEIVPGEIAIVHVTLVSPAVGKPQPDMTIVIKGRLIASVGPASSLRVPLSTRVIDGTGRFVIPGLWDMHSHFRQADRDLKMDIANGVLGVRDMGGVASEVFPLRDAIERGQRLGPKIVASGAIVDGPSSWSNSKITLSVATPDEARAAVQSLKQQGADFIKVYDNLPRDAYYALAAEAAKQGLPFAGHIPNAIAVREASNAGQRTFEHGLALPGGSTIERDYIRWRLNQSVSEEAMRTKNFSLVPAKIARDETAMLNHFSRERADGTYRLLARNGTYLTPTLVTQRSLTFIDELSRSSDPRMQYVTADELKWWKPENGMLTKYRTPEYIAMRKREYAKTLEEIPRARSLGVRFLAGTDITIPYTYPGFSLHDELGLFVEAGLTPLQALETATVNPARLLGLSTWGRIETGCRANLVLLAADPLVDISNTKLIESVVVEGNFMDRFRLDQLLDESRIPTDPIGSAGR